jgi:hypothetical protein
MTWPWELDGGWFVGSAVICAFVLFGVFLVWVHR